MEQAIKSLIFTVILYFFAGNPIVQAKRHTVCVAESKDESFMKENCTGSVKNCTSFECIRETLALHNSTQVLFLVPEITLPSSVEFYDLSNVSFEGHSENGSTAVVCSESIVKSGEGAGLSFIRVQDLQITDMIFKFCGGWHNSTSYYNIGTNSTVSARSSIYILNSANVSIVRVVIMRSTGRGLVLYDTGGTVEIKDCEFIENKEKDSSGGGGVYVEFTSCTLGIYKECTKSKLSVTKSIYRFLNCHLISNTAFLANDSQTHNTGRVYQGFGKGGGMCIYLPDSGAHENNFNISNCSFRSNVAVWGGGLYISYHGNSASNNITIVDSNFTNNCAESKGGGGVAIGHSFVGEVSPNENQALFKNCMFFHNHAVFGGGTLVFATRNDSEGSMQNKIKFSECWWSENTARIGSAVDIVPHQWDTVRTGQLITLHEFEDCNFTRNWCVPKYADNIPEPWSIHTQALGALAVTASSVHFIGRTVFANNNGSGLYLVSSVASFESGTNAEFKENQGQEGGAIALIGFSSLQVKENSNFIFKENRAKIRGGAIFHMSVDYHDYLFTRSCFIQYHGYPSKPVNVNFIFESNEAGLSRHSSKGNQSLKFSHSNSIFASSILPCYYACHSNNESEVPKFNDTFECTGNFTYHPHYDASKEIRTSTHDIKINGTIPHIISGKKFKLPFEAYDDFGTEVVDVYQASVDCDSIAENCIDSAIKVKNPYIRNKKIRLFGQPHSKGRISLYQGGLLGHVISVDIEMDHCPPGYILQATKNSNLSVSECKCSANSPNASYLGITSCDSDTFQAKIQKGYWIGYVNKACDCNTSAVTEQQFDLLSAQCPFEFCFPKSKNLSHFLPNTSNATLLDGTVCGNTRTGALCGKCNEGFSVFFHQDLNFLSCNKNKLCNIGWVFYILSELAPLTVLFTFVMIFNISFTSGAVNGFILFAQMYDTLDITAHNFLSVKHEELWALTKIINFVYKFFNMEFFDTSYLSFCLWRGAGSLDILAMKYVTMAYALVLIVIMILLMNVTSLYRICNFLRPQKFRNSVIHGLSTFLVMCYAQCAKVTFKILSPAILYDSEKAPKRMVLLYYGEIDFFSGDHLPYAIPAVFCLIFILILPPLFLLIYPNSYRILSPLGISESAWFRKVSKFFPISKMMPLFDSFQSCFKDNVRFFSGLYFAYRLIVLASSAVFVTHNLFYTISSVLFSVMLMLHALAQPYVVKWHNIVDTLIFTDLILINCLTLYNYVRTKTNTAYQTEADKVFAIQYLLALLPLLYMLIYLLIRPSVYVWKRVCGTKSQEDDKNELPARLLRELLHSESMAESDYHSFQDSNSMM